MRLLKITGVDLHVFEFDHDLTWAAFFMNASDKVYGRFGGRDAKGPDARNTLPGLRHAMVAALAEHRKDPTVKPANPQAPLYIENLPAAKGYRGCIHCHQTKEIIRAEQIKAGTWDRNSIYVYPLPENLGIILDRERGDLVRQVKPASPADKAGLKPGDILQSLNTRSVYSYADAQYALHKSPAAGAIPIAWQRDGKPMNDTLTLPARWRFTNITWRPSLLDLLPSLTVYGEDLTANEKKALGLDEKRLAFRQQKEVHSAAKAMGIQAGDIILGIDNPMLEMTMLEFLAHVRQNYLIGESATLHVLRDGKRLELKVKLK